VGAIAGTGRDGLVTMADVEGRVAPAASTPARAAAVAPDRRAVIRGIVARTMEPSALIPQFTVWRDLELDAADRHRNGLSWTTVLLRAYASSLRRVPELLSRWEDGRPVDSGPPTIAVAVATDRGLLVPVFADPDLGAAADLDAEMRQVVVEAQRGRVGPAHLGVANGSLSNLGGLGVDRFQALLTPPQASVLSVGAVKRRPVAVPGGIGLALTVTVGLTVDHRVADGVHAAQVLSECQEFLRKLADGS
jgi:pyruvate dehydrogenase E2 component (dihydrolipoamide acetyltransferase)